jgi:hypothetical protein
MMKNLFLKTALVAGALLTAAVVPASAQGFGFGFSTGGGRDHVSGYYSDYGRGYGDRYSYGSYNRPYGDYGYGGYGYGWRDRDDWRWRRHHWRHRWDY